MKIGIVNNEVINDQIEPEIVLLGLIFVNFLPLKILPKKNPPRSELTQTIIE